MNHKTEHPLIHGLFDSLPAAGAEWPMADRLKWLRAAASITGQLYQKPLDEAESADIVVQMAETGVSYVLCTAHHFHSYSMEFQTTVAAPMKHVCPVCSGAAKNVSGPHINA